MSTCDSAAHLLAVIVGLSAATISDSAGAQTPGMTYRMHVTQSAARSGRARAAAPTEWTAIVMWAAGRGRMDIVDGRQAGLFETGDYVLFDSTEYITVHPPTKSFYGPAMGGASIAAVAKKGMAESGIAMKIDKVRASLDTLTASEVIDGHATQHYRMNLGYTITTDASALLADIDPADLPPEVAAELAPSISEVTTTSELWLARLPELPQPPFAGTARVARDLVGDVAQQVSALRAALPTGTVALRSVITTRMSRKQAGHADAATNDSTVLRTDIQEIRTLDVDVSRLVLPSGFVEGARPALAALHPEGVPPAVDHAAKWRSKPVAR